MYQLELEHDDAHNEVDSLDWKLDNAERDAELEAARIKKRAQADYKKKLEGRYQHIALVKEKLRRLGKHKAREMETPHSPQAEEAGVPPPYLRIILCLYLVVDVWFDCHCQPCLHSLVRRAGMMRTCLNGGCRS